MDMTTPEGFGQPSRPALPFPPGIVPDAVGHHCSSPADFFFQHAAEAVIFTDAQGAVVHQNATAERLIARSEGLAILPDGMLVTADRASNARLSRLVGLVARSVQSATERQEGVVAVKRPRGQMPLLISVKTLPRPFLATPSLREVSAMITFADPDTPPPSLVDPVAEVFGLTRAERRVVAGVLEGLKAREISVRLGISINTVNTHVKRVYAKTGVRRHGDLIRLCMHLALSIRPTDPRAD